MSKRIALVVRISLSATVNANWTTTSHTDEVPSVATVSDTAIQLPFAVMHCVALFVLSHTRQKNIHATFQFARKVPLVHTLRYAAQTAILLTRLLIPTALNALNCATSPIPPRQTRMRQTRETPPWREWPNKWPSLHPLGPCSC